MKRAFHSATAIVGFVAALTFVSAATAAGYALDQDLGSPGNENIYERVITIAPNAKWVNVNRDETIKFVDASSGRSFVWNFKTPADRFDLNKVAPPGVLSGRQVVVYVGLSQRDIGRSR